MLECFKGDFIGDFVGNQVQTDRVSGSQACFGGGDAHNGREETGSRRAPRKGGHPISDEACGLL